MKLKLFPVFVLIMIPCLGILQCCTPLGTRDDEDPCTDHTEHYYLTSGSVPYNGYDTIIMVSNTGDTITCIGAGKQPFTTSRFVLAGNPACGNHGTEHIYEANKIDFVDSLKITTIIVSQYKYYDGSPFNGWAVILFDIKKKQFILSTDNLYISGASTYIGDINISNRIYRDVHKILNKEDDTTCYVLINKSNGLIQFNLNQNERWNLLK